jgi:hypothetical protein
MLYYILGGRPWLLVDARDVAMAEILMAESGNIESGERFMLSSSDKVHPEVSDLTHS